MKGRVDLRRERGAALVETALTLLAFLIFVFGIFEIARFFNVQQTLSTAAREGARFAVAPQSQTANLPTEDEIRSRVLQVLGGAHIPGTTVEVERPVTISLGGIDGQYTRVRVTVPYQVLTIPFLFDLLEVTLEGEAVMRNETSP